MADVKRIIRVAQTDLDGTQALQRALRKIRGISFMTSGAICKALALDSHKQAGMLTEVEVKKIEDLLKKPDLLPHWILNRRSDYETGEDKHIVAGQIQFVKTTDVKRLQEIKSYRGLRHAWGLPLRGQRTRSNFRKGKSVGVSKKSKQPAKKKSTPASGGKKK